MIALTSSSALSSLLLDFLEHCLVEHHEAILLRVYEQNTHGFVTIQQTQILFGKDKDNVKGLPSDALGINALRKNTTVNEKGNSTGQYLLEIVASFADSGKVTQVVELEGQGVIENEMRRGVVLEWITTKVNLLVLGAGHIGQCVASLGVGLGYKVIIVDDRRDFASRLRFPDERIELMAGGFSEILCRLPVSKNFVVVIATRGHQYDEVCLEHIIQTEARYIGMIGSKRRVQAIINKLVEAGTSPELLSKVFAPIGLPIGAKTPQEIGIAIIAEVVACLNGAGIRNKA